MEKKIIAKTQIKMESDSILIVIFSDATIYTIVAEEETHTSISNYLGTASALLNAIVVALCEELALDSQFHSYELNKEYCDWL